MYLWGGIINTVSLALCNKELGKAGYAQNKSVATGSTHDVSETATKMKNGMLYAKSKIDDPGLSIIARLRITPKKATIYFSTRSVLLKLKYRLEPNVDISSLSL